MNELVKQKKRVRNTQIERTNEQKKERIREREQDINRDVESTNRREKDRQKERSVEKKEIYFSLT